MLTWKIQESHLYSTTWQNITACKLWGCHKLDYKDMDSRDFESVKPSDMWNYDVPQLQDCQESLAQTPKIWHQMTPKDTIIKEHQPIPCKFREISLQSNINIVLHVYENEGELDNISWSFPSHYFTVWSECCILCKPKPTDNNFSPKLVYSWAWSVVFNRGVIQ